MSKSNYKDSRALFKQQDARWKDHNIGGTFLTLGSHGCTITCVCRMFYVLFDKLIEPDTMEELLRFDNKGRLIWSSVEIAAEYLGFKLKFRGRYREIRPSFSLLTSYCMKEDKFMLLELKTLPIRHWVTAESNWVPPFVSGMDPLKAAIRKKPYWKISGFTCFSLSA